MIDFKKIELKDKEWMDPLIALADMRACHQNFTNMFAWSQLYKYQVACVNDYLVVKGMVESGPYYLYPVGAGDIKTVIEAMKADAAEKGDLFRIFGLSPANKEELKMLYPDQFEYEYMRDSSDYVYYLDKLVNLKGNKMHSKRNHMNYFKKNNSWSFELISADNLAECRKMNDQWCLEHRSMDDIYLYSEYCAVRCCFDHYWDLGLEGGLIRVDGKVIAFTIGEVLSSDTYDIHIEKAFGEIRGSYQVINREYAAYIQETYPHLVYVNREEDMGYEGLRKAKLSYHPDMMEDKYAAVLIEETTGG